jgi:hypothetical protein
MSNKDMKNDYLVVFEKWQGQKKFEFLMFISIFSTNKVLPHLKRENVLGCKSYLDFFKWINIRYP